MATESGNADTEPDSEEGEEQEGPQPPARSPQSVSSPSDEDHAAGDELLKAAQVRIECAKVCAPAQLAELLEGSHAVLARLRGVRAGHGLRRLLPAAIHEHQALLTQLQQRSGTIRVVVRVRPSVLDDQTDAAVKVLPGGARNRGLELSVKHGGRRADVHSFKRFDYILGADKDQESVFRELQVMLPNAQHGLSGPPQSACILAYGQTGSGKTHTMSGGDGKQQGLVPRVLVEVFRLAHESEASISLSVVEIYNDIAYDLLDDSRAEHVAAEEQGRAFQGGRAAPPPGLNFRHGCASALGQAKGVGVANMDEACAVLAKANDRRSTRSTCFNATSSRSHSIVLLHASLPEGNPNEPALRIAFVDLAGSERLPAAENKGPVADESRHINLSLSALGSVIHALRHRSNHLPYRACLMTRLLEPFFGSSGRVLMCVCISPEQRFAQETLCSLNFADRASRAVLGADSSSEVQRSQALSIVREAHSVMRSMLRELLPRGNISSGTKQRLPDTVAATIILCLAEHGAVPFVCRAWARICESYVSSGQKLQHSRAIAERILKFAPAMEATGVCRCWWSAAGAYRITVEAASAKVLQAHAGSSRALWAPASAKTRMDMWKALLKAGGGSGAIGDLPLANVRECVIAGSPRPEALKQVLMRCPELRVVEIPEPDLVSVACAGLMKCAKLRALRCGLTLMPNVINMRQVLISCRQLRVLSFTGTSDHLVSLEFLTDELPKGCGLRELAVARCSANWKDIDKLSKSCARLQVLRFPKSFVETGESALSPPPLLALARLKHLRSIDFRAWTGKKYKQRPWLTEDMFGVVGQLKELREVRVTEQKLLGERCFQFLRRHAPRLRILHLDGCKPMCGDLAFGVLHLCDNLESLKLPALHVGESGKILGTGTSRWCQGLHCPRLRELCVDAWASLEDAGVQMLVRQCGLLHTVWLRQAPRLSDDSVTYLASLRHLSSLCLSGNAGLTDQSLQELASASQLRCLDLSGCRQLTEAGVVKFADSIAAPPGPRLTSLRLDACPHLGRAVAEALAARPSLDRCSLAGCRPMPEAVTAWVDGQGHIAACQALGMEPPVALGLVDGDGLPAAPLDFDNQPTRAAPVQEEAVQCAICMDEILSHEAMWECPVCCNKLHDSEDCARGWLRLRQSCPTCRAVAWAPPDEPAAANPFRAFHVPVASRPRPSRALSADAPESRFLGGSATPTSGVASSMPDFSIAGLSAPGQGRQVLPRSPEFSVGGLSSGLSAHGRAPRLPVPPRSQELGRPRPGSDSGLGVGSRRPPRPTDASPAASAGRLAAALALGLAPSSTRSAPAVPRSRSLPARQGPGQGFALAGLAIVGSSRS
mmetsp:Transcript_57865/g.188084  ORF Transcript_57865/g.188084 Transcript_57865/m.188084 type:complete len:1345 (+) Transcript_57865:234-4268(+)